MKFFVAAIALAAFTPEAPFNPFDDLALESAIERDQYRTCTSLVGADPQAGRDYAEKWAAEGGGAAALHCQAVGDLAAGFPKLAAVRLMQIAERKDIGDGLLRARYLEQAAIAWLEAGAAEYADEAINDAIQLAPNAGELSLTAGIVNAANQRWGQTISAIDAAAEQGFKSADGLVARAKAHKALLNNLKAAEDVVGALRIDPFNLDALVLRGELQQLGIEIDANYQRSR
ncbi:MAG: hypothetical protein AAGJ73_06135 [Pseudomonadota bacterium]